MWGEVNVNGKYVIMEVGKQYSVDADNDGGIDFKMELTKMLFGKMFITFYYVGEIKVATPSPKTYIPPPTTAIVDKNTFEQPAKEKTTTIRDILPSTSTPLSQKPVGLAFDWKLIAVGALLAVVLITGLAVVIKKSKGKTQPPPPTKPPVGGAMKIDSKLMDYIRDHRKNGYADDQIASHLMKFHTQKQILDAFESVDMPKMKAYISKYKAKGYSDRQIKAALEKKFAHEEVADAFKK